MHYPISKFSDEELAELSAVCTVFYPVARGLYGALQDAAIAEDVRRQRARRSGQEPSDAPPVEIVLQVRGEPELRAAARHIASHAIAAERAGEFPRLAEIFRVAMDDLIDLAAAQVEARGGATVN